MHISTKSWNKIKPLVRETILIGIRNNSKLALNHPQQNLLKITNGHNYIFFLIFFTAILNGGMLFMSWELILLSHWSIVQFRRLLDYVGGLVQYFTTFCWQQFQNFIFFLDLYSSIKYKSCLLEKSPSNAIMWSLFKQSMHYFLLS